MEWSNKKKKNELIISILKLDSIIYINVYWYMRSQGKPFAIWLHSGLFYSWGPRASCVAVCYLTPLWIILYLGSQGKLCCRLLSDSTLDYSIFGVPGKAVLPFAIWLHPGLLLLYLGSQSRLRCVAVCYLTPFWIILYLGSQGKLCCRLLSNSILDYSIFGVPGQAVLPFAIWLHPGLFYPGPTFVLLV